MPLSASKLTGMLKSTRSESNHCVYKLDILEGCSTACCTPHPLVCEAKCVCGRQTEGARSSGEEDGSCASGLARTTTLKGSLWRHVLCCNCSKHVVERSCPKFLPLSFRCVPWYPQISRPCPQIWLFLWVSHFPYPQWLHWSFAREGRKILLLLVNIDVSQAQGKYWTTEPLACRHYWLKW